jgi:hypothetical protein
LPAALVFALPQVFSTKNFCPIVAKKQGGKGDF